MIPVLIMKPTATELETQLSENRLSHVEWFYNKISVKAAKFTELWREEDAPKMRNFNKSE